MTATVQTTGAPTAGAEAREIVTGVDGSAAADAALDWALGEAALRGLAVRALRVEDPVTLASVAAVGAAPPPIAPEGQEARLAELADEAVEKAVARTGVAVPVTAVGVVASPRQALVEASETAALVVVGRRGAGRLRHLLLGSVASAVVHHATGPVAVVPEGWTRQPSRGGTSVPRVVVGYDGSAAAGSALAFAATAAARRGAVLEVLLAWQIVTLLPAVADTPGTTPPLAEYEALADRLLGRARAQVDEGASPPEVRTRSVHSAPARALLAAAEDAELLVVGARGAGGFADLLLGSVSTQVARHAACPVVVVREGEERVGPSAAPTTRA